MVRRKYFFLFPFALVVVLYLCFYSNIQNYIFIPFNIVRFSMRNRVVAEKKTQRGYLIDTDVCKIPDIDPFDPSIAKLIHKRGPVNCSQKPTLTFQRGDTVFVNQKLASKIFGNSTWYCGSDKIERAAGDKDNKINLVPNQAKFTKSYVLTSEFTRIRCVKSNVPIYYNFYAINTRKPDAEERHRKVFQKHVVDNSLKRSYNVLIVGLDSVSRLNFVRNLPKTREYLLAELGAVEMRGYNRLGYNTFRNIVTLTSGKFVQELPYDLERDRHKPFDDFDFIFKNFAAAGYRVLNAEDQPSLVPFNFLKEGFNKPPADDYFRPMALAMEANESVWTNEHVCLHDRMEVDIFSEYLFRFMRANSRVNRPYYGFLYQTRITHDDMNRAALADAPNVEFLKRIHKSKFLDDTIMFFFADHGVRYGEIRRTFVGKISTRLPAMYVYLPPSFRRDYPTLYKNLVINANRLTTHFDTYETLRDILFFNDSVGRRANLSSRGISLFSEIPTTRTCHHAGIEPHWCSCNREVAISTDDSSVRKLAYALVNHINKILTNSSHICEVLRLSRITQAYKLSPIANSSNSRLHHRITVVTSPGDGMFEGTLKYKRPGRGVEIAGGVSRTNSFGKTSWCVTVGSVERFCYCRKQLP